MSRTRPRLLVIGSSGFVGGWLAHLGREQFDVIEGARQSSARLLPGGGESVAIDLAQPESMQVALEAARPSVVILTAALADIDRCERQPEMADAVNRQGSAAVARECQRRGARMIFTSTDAVFDGLSPPYAENAAPTPINHYGRTKAAAEAAIRAVLPAAVIVRPSLVLGFSVGAEFRAGPPPALRRANASANNSYLDKLAATLLAGKSVSAPADELRNPIDVGTFAQALLRLAEWPLAAGVFHVGASDKMSRYELARRLATELRCSRDLVTRQNEPPPGRAPRGRDDFLLCRRLPGLTGFTVPTCEQVIHQAVHGTA